jgi:hypothetical protein
MCFFPVDNLPPTINTRHSNGIRCQIPSAHLLCCRSNTWLNCYSMAIYSYSSPLENQCFLYTAQPPHGRIWGRWLRLGAGSPLARKCILHFRYCPTHCPLHIQIKNDCLSPSDYWPPPNVIEGRWYCFVWQQKDGSLHMWADVRAFNMISVKLK